MNDSELIVVQGDTCNTSLTISGAGADTIEEAFFSCSKLNLIQKLPYDEESCTYILYLSQDQTKNFKPIITNFDITAKIKGNMIKTIIYRGKLTVLEKNNPVEV